jgi:hypothetical protein
VLACTQQAYWPHLPGSRAGNQAAARICGLARDYQELFASLAAGGKTGVVETRAAGEDERGSIVIE